MKRASRVKQTEPTKRRTTRDLVVSYIRDGILHGELKPMQRLNVHEVASVLGISQTPVREALQQLAAEGLVRLHAFRGARVSELSAEEYEEIFLMRVGLESLAARVGAELIDGTGVGEMRSRLAEMSIAADHGDVDEFINADRAFHRAHYMASGRERLWDRIIHLRYDVAERYTRLGYQLPDVGMADVLASHALILEAVARHDGEAVSRLVEEDLRRTFESVSRKLREDEARVESSPSAAISGS